MYKFTFSERKRKLGTPGDVAEEFWEESDNATSASKKVMAGVLRAKADELDPQDKTVYRGY